MWKVLVNVKDEKEGVGKLTDSMNELIRRGAVLKRVELEFQGFTYGLWQDRDTRDDAVTGFEISGEISKRPTYAKRGEKGYVSERDALQQISRREGALKRLVAKRK